MSTNTFVDYYTQIIGLYNRGDLAEFQKAFAPDYIHHNPGLPDVQTLDHYMQMHKDFRASFPDQQVTIDEVISQGTFESGSAAIHYRVKGTGKGTYQDRTVDGKTVDFDGALFHKFVNGKLVEGWELYDLLTERTQLGLIPAAVGSTPA